MTLANKFFSQHVLILVPLLAVIFLPDWTTFWCPCTFFFINFTNQKDQREYTGYYTKKYTPLARDSAGTAISVTDGKGANSFQISQFQDFVAIRYSDVLLMAAEAEIEVGSLATARTYINRVRARAAASPVLNGAVNAANYVINTYPVDFANKDVAREAVRFERKLELGMEGHRFFDLVRWGIADVVLNNEYFPKEGARRVESLGGSVFTKNKHEYLPIPGSVITASIVDGVPTLKQNPGY